MKINLKNNVGIIVTAFIALLFGTRCAQAPGKDTQNTPNTGQITVAVDETLLPIAEAQAQVFNATYERAHIHMRYKSEAAAVNDLMNDSAQMIMIGRPLKPDEKAFFDSRRLMPQQTKVALDGIALITHKNNKDTELTYPQVVQILKGEITDRKQLGKGGSGNLNLVFDNSNSGTVSFVLNEIGAKSLPKNAFATKTNTDAIQCVSENENTIGIVGWSWMSDSDDPKTKVFLSKINVIGISPKHDSLPKGFYRPYQLPVRQGLYPFTRDVYCIVRDRSAGLASGFSRFIYGDIGQRIMMKAGIVPAQEPERVIEIVKKPVQ
jgi:phosphate transport system substrate-binding protein